MKHIITIITIMTCVYGAEIPTGQTTAEGVACDLATSFIKADKSIWNKIVMPAKEGDYKDFLDFIANQMDEQAKIEESKRAGPQKIISCYKMGHLSKNGPNSHSYAAFNYSEIGFVDVCVADGEGNKFMNRTFVYKDGEKWFALPRPDLFPLLTDGLNNENQPAEIVYSE